MDRAVPTVDRLVLDDAALPWAEVWFRTADEERWQAASVKARALGKSGLEVRTTEEHPEVVSFFEARGDEEVRRYVRFALDVDQVADPGEPEWKLTTLAERPELLDEVYEIARETYVDQPGREDAEIGPIELWRLYAVDPHPKDAFFVALDDGRVVGFGFLALEGNEGWHQMSGVAPAWRGRAAADAIKRAQIRWAKANGLRTLQTANETRIAAITG